MFRRLFSETNLLVDEVIFRNGLNIVLGKYSRSKDESGINGIGKSTLIRLINFALISESSERKFLESQYDFLRNENHSITLELSIGQELFFIKRTFKKNDPIFFGKSEKKLKKYSKAELKAILGDLFFPIENEKTFLEGERFGTLMNFYIKDDIHSFLRREPQQFMSYQAKSKEIALFNFFLLNLPTKNLINFSTLCTKHEAHVSQIKFHESKIKTTTNRNIEEFRSEKIKIQKKIELLEESLNQYNFLEIYKNIEQELIELTNSINQKLANLNSLESELNKVYSSVQLLKEFDTENIKKIYNEALENFGTLVKKKLDEVVDFKNQLISNRNKFLVNRIQKLERTIEDTYQEISEIEKKRSRLYRHLDEQGALQSIKNTYEQLIIEKTYLERNLQELRSIEELENKVSDLDIEISNVRRLIINDIRESDEQINTARSLFQEILSKAIYVNETYSKAYFDISIWAQSPKTKLPFKIEVEVPKDDALGQSRLKLICYDLMIFFYSILSNRKSPNFLAHDGVFHGIALKSKINILNFIFHAALEKKFNHPFQYIVTFNEDEVFLLDSENNNQAGEFSFEWESCVIAKYEDSPEKMIFKRVFDL